MKLSFLFFTGSMFLFAASLVDARDNSHERDRSHHRYSSEKYMEGKKRYRDTQKHHHRSHRQDHHKKYAHKGSKHKYHQHHKRYHRDDYWLGGLLIGGVIHHSLHDGYNYRSGRHYRPRHNYIWNVDYGQCYKVKRRYNGDIYVEVPRRYCR